LEFSFLFLPSTSFLSIQPLCHISLVSSLYVPTSILSFVSSIVSFLHPLPARCHRWLW
jgi:hypothetical protein